MTKKLLLTQGQYAIVDDDWYEMLSVIPWFARKKRNISYEVVGDTWVNGKTKMEYIYFVVMPVIL